MPQTITRGYKALLAEADAKIDTLPVEDAIGLHGQDGVVFVDLREPAEITASGKVPGALAIPRGLLEFRADKEGASPDPALTGAETRHDLVTEHRAICDGIRDGDTERALKALEKHYDDAVVSLTNPQRRTGVGSLDGDEEST